MASILRKASRPEGPTASGALGVVWCAVLCCAVLVLGPSQAFWMVRSLPALQASMFSERADLV